MPPQAKFFGKPAEFPLFPDFPPRWIAKAGSSFPAHSGKNWIPRMERTPHKTDAMKSDSTAEQPIPPDDPGRVLTIADPDKAGSLPHVGVAGGTYTVILGGADTAGRYCLIDMQVPPGGGPPPHRHDFEETFTILEGEIEATFRGEKTTVRAGMTLHIPANAPHSFVNSSDKPARMLCTCAPAGQEEFFLAVGTPVGSRTAIPPKPSESEKAETVRKVESLLPKYRTEMLHG